MPSERVLILYNEPILPPDHPEAASEGEVFETVEIIHQILDEGGFDVGRLGIGVDLQPLLDCLSDDPPDAVFNLFEGLADRPFTETVVAGILEWFDVSFTGSPSESLSLSRDKQRTKYLMQGAGLLTAPFFVVEQLPVPQCTLPWPVIVKPAAQDASVGIDQRSVVTDQAQLEARTAHVLDRYGTALVEQFVKGREILVNLIEVNERTSGRRELQSLPLAEIVFTDPSVWPIYSYDAKWSLTSPEHLASPLQVGVSVPSEWRERIVAAARTAFRLLGCRDYARVDMRVTADGQPYILEVNPNPCISSITVIDGMAQLGTTHAEFVCGLVRAALARRSPAAQAAQKPSVPRRNAAAIGAPGRG